MCLNVYKLLSNGSAETFGSAPTGAGREGGGKVNLLWQVSTSAQKVNEGVTMLFLQLFCKFRIYFIFFLSPVIPPHPLLSSCRFFFKVKE